MPESAHWLGGAGWVVVEPEGFFGGNAIKRCFFEFFWHRKMGPKKKREMG